MGRGHLECIRLRRRPVCQLDMERGYLAWLNGASRWGLPGPIAASVSESFWSVWSLSSGSCGGCVASVLYRRWRIARGAWDRLTQEFLDRSNLILVVVRHKARCTTHRLHPSGAPDPVHIVLRALREVVVDHVTDIGYIDSAGRNIGCHQHSIAPAAEAFQGFSPLWE